MRSRSSRLFVVLLHLVGVSTNFPRNPLLAALYPDSLPMSSVGIVGVHPLSILLEPLELQAAGGLGELLSLLQSAGYDVEKTVLGQPYWLQDDTDGKCLGPDGFAECGDATLWKIRRRPVIYDDLFEQQKHKVSIEYKEDSRTTNWFLAIFNWEKNDDESKPHQTNSSSTNSHDDNDIEMKWEYALELVDVNSSPPFRDNINEQDKLGLESSSSREGECILSFSIGGASRAGSLELGSCSDDKVWSWSINEGGVLRWDERAISHHGNIQRSNEFIKTVLGGPFVRVSEISSSKIEDKIPIIRHQPSQCLWRFNETSARTEPCDASSNDTRETINRRLVGLSVIQYQNSAAVSPKLPRFTDGADQSGEASTDAIQEEDSNLPHTNSISKSRSTSGSQHLKNVPTGIAGYFERSQLKSNVGPKLTTKRTIKNLSPVGVGGYFEAKQQLGQNKNDERSKNNVLHHSVSSNLSHYDSPHKPRKIPVHPYIAVSREGFYEDPNTGLKFPTDIHAYLGHNREEADRHTLMGVGLFTKTFLKIKIYSVGLYVSKRDVLADSNYAPYADMSSEELRSNDNFYNTLLSEGTIDKTLFIKLNMQLATETVRQSLSAEWKLLSDNHKHQLASSSAKERQAQEGMLRTIQHEDNTGNCSCGQSAPPEYEADESCCARGTEMVFTWRKNGNLELRIDGRLMDTFTDPIIGKGIFFEYLRGDDPMSMDAREHFTDGFPFLLAPLAQVKGISSSVPNNHDSSSQNKKAHEQRTPFLRVGQLTEDIMNNISTKASEFSAFVQDNVNGGITNVGNTLNSMSRNTRLIGSNIERMREQIISQLSSEHLMSQLSPEQIKHSISIWQDQSMRFLVTRFPFLEKHTKLKEDIENQPEIEMSPKSPTRKRDILSHHLEKMLDEISSKRPISDEIGVIIEPTMSSTHLLFLYMVHFYLVLLLIVSVPDSNSNRLVKMRRSSVSTVDSESDHEERVTELEAISCEINCWGQGPVEKVDRLPFVVEASGSPNLKKSLSYYL